MTTSEIILGLAISIVFVGMGFLLFTDIVTYLPKKLKFLSTKLICKILASKTFYYIVWLYWQKIRKNDCNFKKFNASRENLKVILSKK